MRSILRWTGCVGICVVGLSACAQFQDRISPILEEWTPFGRWAERGAGGLPTQEQTRPEELDQSTDAERIAAASSPLVGAVLGATVASLGTPTEPGFWLKTPLVSVDIQGRVRDPRTGASVEVQLIPIEGPETAGSRISLSAMRTLGVPLGDLVVLEVRGGS